jgi:hypothetical protein
MAQPPLGSKRFLSKPQSSRSATLKHTIVPALEQVKRNLPISKFREAKSRMDEPTKATKAEVLQLFNEAWADPAARFGEVGDDIGRRLIHDLLPDDRDAVLEVLRDWIREPTNAGRATFALRMAREFRFTELLPDIKSLDAAVKRGEALLPFYAEWTELAIRKLSSASE